MNSRIAARVALRYAKSKLSPAQARELAVIKRWNDKGHRPKPTPNDSDIWYELVKKGVARQVGGFFEAI